MSIKNLSVFFPLFNEEGNVKNSVEKAIRVLDSLKIEYEILLINDGSSDRTGQIADGLSSKNSRIKVIHHEKNLGYGEALKSGFYNAKYDTIVYTDADGQFDFSQVTKFLEKIKDHDLVIGYRIKRQDPFFRILFKMGWKMSLLVFFGLTLKDADCGFKMVRKEVLQKIPHLFSSRGAMINAELAILAKKMGFKIAEVGVTHYPRFSGKPTGANLGVIIKSFLDLVRLWWKFKENKKLFLALLAILILASFLRFYRLGEYMTFLGDEGRDAIVIKNMLVGHHFPAIGPPTSVGNIYLGPLYYYMMAIPMAIFWLNPVAAAGMNALIGIATVGLIYYLGKIWFGKAAGLVSAYLYAISPVTIIYSRSSWNPNPTSFFALIAIFSLYKLHQTGNFLWLTLTGLAVGASLQMHYLAVILIPIFTILWLLGVFVVHLPGVRMKHVVGGTMGGVLTFLAVMSPLVWFDLRHDFLNYRAITKLINDGIAVRSDIFANIAKIPSLYSYNLIGRYMTAENFYLTIIVSVLVIGVLMYKFSSWTKLMLGVWLFVGLVGLTFYQQTVYDHYLGFMNPVPFLLLGSIAAIRIPTFHVGRYFLAGGLGILIVFLTVVNLQRTPLLTSPNNQLKRTQEVAKFIISQAGKQDFNFALIAKNNYDSAYQFYLDRYGHKPKMVPFEVTGQLFVVCEDAVCDPTHSPKYEVAAFGWSKIDWVQEFYGVKVYKLISNPSGKP